MKLLWPLVAAAALLLTSSATRQLPEQNTVTRPERLFQALHLGNPDALMHLEQVVLRITDESLQRYWLTQLGERDSVVALVALAERSVDLQQRSHWLSRASRMGSPEAQFLLGLETQHTDKRMALLKASAEQNYLPAQSALANWFLMNSEPEKALPWLKQTAAHYAEDAFALGKVMAKIESEQAFNQSLQYFTVAAELGHEQAAELVDVAMHHRPENPNTQRSELRFDALRQSEQPRHCAMRIMPVTLSLESQAQAIHLIDQLKDDKRLSELPICVADPIWLADKDQWCSKKQQAGRERFSCDLTRLSSTINANDVTHVIVFAEKARAYVDRGAMYIDLTDPYSVLVHELAHFAGFADEYPITTTLARHHCKTQRAPNLVFDGEITYAPMSRLRHWQTQTQSLIQEGVSDLPLTLHPARTCQNIDQVAYKLTAERTFMEFHDIDFIPAVYRRLWREQILNQHHWYPVALNIAEHYRSIDQLEKAREWLVFAVTQQERVAGIGRENYLPTSPLRHKLPQASPENSE
ncbi:tetratricopeptide repeat protein [Alteromonas oceanisediminis]|uniref:tetratricopeptide repeat protein n=1 Tax=Alteromonas oceanisediminis TaxID=2836180 RepID=UPI001BD9A894|nr:hypothetical protein [Alteromonas oceanisediminis]MBT0586508.1 hypothetical protein [Alteromonas oceanisediminis]